MNDNDTDGNESDGVECEWEGCKRSFNTERGMKMHHVQIHDESIAGNSIECDWCGDEISVADWEMEYYDHHFCPMEKNNCIGKWKSENQTGSNSPTWNGGKVTVSCTWCREDKKVKQNVAENQYYHFCTDKNCEGKFWSANNSGSDSPHWNGGASDIYYSIKSNLMGKGWQTISEKYREEHDECEICGEQGNDTISLHVHHIIPIVSGGTNGKWNLVVLCPKHHSIVENYTRSFTDQLFDKEYYE